MTFFLIFIPFMTANAENLLKTDHIDQYLTSLKRISVMMERYNKDNKTPPEQEVPPLPAVDELSKTPITDSLIFVRNHPTFSRFENIVTSAGFENIEQWADTGDKIMMAYSAYYLKNPEGNDAKPLAMIIEDLSAQREQIDNNQFISPEQKKTLIQKIENSIAMLNDPNYIDNENIMIISPYIKRLNSLFKEQQ